MVNTCRAVYSTFLFIQDTQSSLQHTCALIYLNVQHSTTHTAGGIEPSTLPLEDDSSNHSAATVSNSGALAVALQYKGCWFKTQQQPLSLEFPCPSSV